MILQEQIERQPEPALREPTRAAMTGRTALGKQLWRRLVLIKILRVGRRAAQRGHDRNNKKTAARFR